MYRIIKTFIDPTTGNTATKTTLTTDDLQIAINVCKSFLVDTLSSYKIYDDDGFRVIVLPPRANILKNK
ncbi:hypothetical protein [Capybara microvirus Cap1_SP_61]|nr:hypothetical protein [Capybara microvirus Cap1_SP_61]